MAPSVDTICSRCHAIVNFPNHSSYKVKCECGATVLKRVPDNIKYYYCAYTFEIKQMKIVNGSQAHCVCCDKPITINYYKTPVIINGEVVYPQQKEEAAFSHDTKDSGSRNEEIQRLRDEVKRLKAEKEKLSGAFTGCKNVNQYFHKNLTMVKAENDKYKQEIEYERAYAKRMSRVLEEKDEQVKKLQNGLDIQAAEIQGLLQFKKKYEEMEKEKTQLNGRLTELEDDNFLLALNNDELKETIAYLRKELGDATLRCSHANFSLHHKETELEAVKEECEQLETLLAKREQANIRKITTQLQKDLEKMGILSVRVRAEETDYDKKMNALKRELEFVNKAVREIGQKYLKKSEMYLMGTAEILEKIEYRLEEADVLREVILIMEEKLDKAGQKKYVKPLEFALD